jgi:cytochrome c2
MIVGRPLSTCLWGLPARWRRSGGTLLQVGPAAAAIRLLGAPVVAWALHGIAIWVWHAPALYDAAVGNEAVHALQHATFVSTAALFWWGLIYGRYGRAGYGAAVFFVFTTVVHTGLLGAILTLADVPLYRAYLRTAAARGLDPLQDQQLAGLVMWIPAGVILTLVGIALFAAWIGEAERRQRATMVAVLAIATAVTACDASPERIARELTGGDPARGRDAVRTYGCDTCHTIPGVLSADATVGPPLTGVAVRTYLAGRIQNTPENLMQWIRSPHTIDEKTAMPETGVTEQDSRDIAAFLYTLR